MKRGFLNSKKAKSQPLYDDGKAEPVVVAPPKQMGDAATTRPEPGVVASAVVGGIVANPRPPEPYALVNLPFLKMTKSKEPSSTCLLRKSTYLRILNTPGFYTPLPPLKYTNPVITKNTHSMGVGLFAGHDFKVGQLVFSERPLLVFPRGFNFSGLEGLCREEAIRKYESKFEVELQRVLGIMQKKNVDAFMGLSNCHSKSPQLYGIAFTNAFGTGIEEENVEEGKSSYGAVGRLSSRINHCCMPNLAVDFDIPTFSLQVIALRNIKAGEQFFYSYCDTGISLKERQRQLARYAFVCQCRACVNATPESDKLREKMDARLQNVINEKEEMFANPLFNIRSLGPLLELEKDIITEGLDFGHKFVDLLEIIFQAYGKLNQAVKESEYFYKVNKYTGQTH